MTPEKQRIAIAEACGWTPDPFGYHVKDPAGIAGPRFRLDELPNYLNDRNAMHEALMTLTARQGNDLCGYLNMMGIAGEWDLITAPLNLLAEAFLRTIDKWEETE
jgi:hypothetical protein